MQPSSAPLQSLLGLPPIPDVSHQPTQQHPLTLPLALPLHLQRPSPVIRSPHRPSHFPSMPSCDGPSPQPHTPWTTISPTAVSNTSNTSNTHNPFNVPPLQPSSSPSPLVSSASLHQPFHFDIAHFHTSSPLNIDTSLSNHNFPSPPADVIPIRHADKLRRLQTPGVVILIDGDALQNALSIALTASFSISSTISYTTLLTLLSTTAHTHPARSVVTAHLISSMPVPNAGSAGLTVHSAAVVVPTLVRILAQESEGVQLIARATNRSFTLVIPPALHYLDIVRHARFSGCDVDLWHLSDPPSEWTAEASVAHENVGALRLHDIRPFLSLISISDGSSQPLVSIPSVPPDGSLASPTSVLSDTTLAHNIQTQAIGGISPTDSDSMAPLASWMTERDLDLHFRHSLPTDLLVEGDTPPPSQSSQATASPPSPPEPPTDSPPVSKAIVGASKSTAFIAVPTGSKSLLPDNISGMNGRGRSRLDSDWRRQTLTGGNGLGNTSHSSNSLGGASIPPVSLNQLGDKSVRRLRCVRDAVVIKDRLMNIGPSSTQGTNIGNTTRSGSSGSARAGGSCSSSCNGSGGGGSGNEDGNCNNADKSSKERADNARTLGSVGTVIASIASKSAGGKLKQKGGRCTYREFCNRRQCNGIHNEVELAYFAKWGGRGRYCVGKQKLCARGMSCDGRRRRSGVCSFLHRGELPFCAACLGCHAGGVCEMDRDMAISEAQATNLVTAGCLVPLNAR